MINCVRILWLCSIVIAVFFSAATPIPAQTIPPYAEYYVEIPTIGVPGDMVSAIHRTTTQYPTFNGFGFAICNDPNQLQPVDIEPGPSLPTDAVGFFFNGYLEPGGAGHACILDGFGAVSVPTGVGHHITTVHYQVVGGASGEEAFIEYCDLADPASGGTVLYFNWLTHEGTTLLPELIIGFPQFKRGDANADGEVDIADAVYSLGCLFHGGPIALCRDAADVNDDGNDNIADVVFALMHLFIPGSPPPPPPFPLCGSDPTGADSLDCEQSTGGC